MRRAHFLRLFGVFSCWVLLYSSLASGLNPLVLDLAGLIEQGLKARPGPYTERPRPAYLGDSPGRAPATRGGMWSARAKAAAQRSRELDRYRELHASTEGAALPPPSHTLACEEAPGRGLPWEGNLSSAQGSVNTGNGNKLTEVPLVSWRERGGMSVDFTLFHNSQTEYNDELGKGWTWTYDIYIFEDSPTAIVHWGDGTAIPFTDPGAGGAGGGGEECEPFDPQAPFESASPSPASGGGSASEANTREGLFDTEYAAPAGIYDKLVKLTSGAWVLTTKDQTKYRFTSAGFCNEIEDRNGNKITITLNAQNYATRITGPSGRYIEISLDANNNFTSITDSLGRVWTFNLNGTTDRLDSVSWPALNGNTYTDAFSYNSDNRITTHIDRRGKVWTFSYNEDGSLASESTPLSHTTGYAYTATKTTITLPGTQTIEHNYSSGKLVSIKDQAGFTESYTRNSANEITQVVDRRGKTWRYMYDSRGNVLTVTNPLNKVWTYTYSAENDLLTEEDPLKTVTEYEYDASGNLVTVTNPLLIVTESNTYDGYGQVVSSQNGELEETTFEYDSGGNLTNIADPLANEWTVAYNDLGWVTSITDPNLITESFTYDEWGRLIVIEHDDETTVQYQYDPTGNVTGVTNERGKTTAYAYDDSGRLTSVTNAKNETETYSYNSNGWRTSVTNGRGKTRNYAYTARGEVYTLTLADNSVETWSYNGNGQVSAYTNPLSQTIGYAFDDAGRLTGIDYPTGTDTSFSYDDANRRTSMTDSTGTTSWTYDAASQLTQLDTPQGTLDYTYNDAGRRLTMDEDGVGVTSYTYDSAGRLTSLENPFEETTSFTYDGGGRVTRRDLANGTYEQMSYDSRNRVTQILLKNSSNSTLQTQSWTYDSASNVLTYTVDGVQTSYGYDDIDQLTSESRTGYSASYTYDANGNRLTKTLGGTTQNYNYDDADKLTAITQGGNTVKSFTYDASGRTTSVTTGAGTTTLAYDYESRVTQITYPNQSTNTFTYNGLDTRVSKVDSGGTKTYMRDGVGVTAPVINDSAASYTPGISEKRSSTSTFYHNGIKNAESQTNSSQSVTGTLRYDAFGLLVSSSGSWNGPFGYGGPFGYQEDGDSGLKLLGHRYYDPSTGRFLTRDVAKHGRNWYGYCYNNPLTWADPTGHSPFGWADDLWVNFSAWWSGTDVVGPGGEPVRVGGWPAAFIPGGTAMTVNETVHLNDYEDYEDYVNDRHWSEHERVHIDQEQKYHGGNAVAFVLTIVWQYAMALSHDGAPYEMEAELGTTKRDPKIEPTGLYGRF